MKKILAIASMAAMVAGAAFAADITGALTFVGSVASGEKNGTTKVFTLRDADQKDTDLVQFAFNAEKAGGSFRLWSPMSNDGAVKARYISFWAQPIDMLKVTFGRVCFGGFTEKIDWWKVPTGQAASTYSGWAGPGRYSSAICGDGFGLGFELFPIDGLTVGACFLPGTNNSWFAKPDSADSTYAAWGAYVSYNVAPMGGKVLAAYRDNGTDSWRQARIGADFNVAGLYGFVDAIAFFDTKAAGGELSGVTLDNYWAYSVGALSLQARFPVTIRGIANDSDVDPSYMTYCVKASYNLGAVTPFLQLMNIDVPDGTATALADEHKAIVFADGNPFNIAIQPGVSFKLGAVACDVRASIDYTAKTDSADATTKWSVPFKCTIGY